MSSSSTPHDLVIGIDLGGTKIEGAAFDAESREHARKRTPAPQGDYAATIAALVDLVHSLETAAGGSARVGIGMPGSLSPATGLVQNSNSTWLNGRALDHDLSTALGRPLRFANDANCFALSEAVDGAGRDARTVFGVILGTGCGGGVVVERRLIQGARSIGGEWGHNPLPWANADEHPGPRCWCGRHGCLEKWLSGPAVADDHQRVTGERISPETIVARANSGDTAAAETLARHASRLARGLAHVMNIVDPDVIVLGGGLSRLGHLYETLPDLIAPHALTARPTVAVLPPRWGDAGGVRGAAWLWSNQPA